MPDSSRSAIQPSLTTCYLALGANLGDHLFGTFQEVVRRLNALDRWTVVGSGGCYTTRPFGPIQHQNTFLNTVLATQVLVHDDPLALLGDMKGLEEALGRQTRVHWGPREVDIDVLDVGGWTWRSERLCLPHAGLMVRDFVLRPLLDIAPDFATPEGRSAQAALEALPTESRTLVACLHPPGWHQGI